MPTDYRARGAHALKLTSGQVLNSFGGGGGYQHVGDGCYNVFFFFLSQQKCDESPLEVD